MDYYKSIQEQGFNGHTAMDIGCILALASLEKSEEEYTKEATRAYTAIEDYCLNHGISDKSKQDFLCEVDEYSMK